MTLLLLTHHSLSDPRWANPIKDVVRRNIQARAINQVVNAMNPAHGELDEPERVLRVVNGMSTLTSSTLTTAAQENVVLAPPSPEGLPSKPQGYSTFRWTGGLHAHAELQETDADADGDSMPDVRNAPEVPPTPRPIIPSLHTLDKAVSARIYFENLYFPLLRQPPSREQRRLAMEKDMENLQLSQAQKEELRTRWRQNETDYLRERRRKVDASAFVKLKTIGHGKACADIWFTCLLWIACYGLLGAFGVVSLVKEPSTGNLYAMKQVDFFWKR
jgi:protein-serine/threonine kinase